MQAPVAAGEVLREVTSIEESLTLLPDMPEIYTAWKPIVHDYNVQGVIVYEARLVAVKNVYAVESILSFNGADFKRYDLVAALHPAILLACTRKLRGAQDEQILRI
jgi:hypothetical protein